MTPIKLIRTGSDGLDYIKFRTKLECQKPCLPPELERLGSLTEGRDNEFRHCYRDADFSDMNVLFGFLEGDLDQARLYNIGLDTSSDHLISGVCQNWWAIRRSARLRARQVCELVAECAAEVVGAENVIRDESVRIMGGEDMAYFLERVPGCYFFLGTRNEEGGFRSSSSVAPL